MLQEAGKDPCYIKLRLRWLSDCFQMYLRNTQRVCVQRNSTLRDVNDMILDALALSKTNIPPPAIHIIGLEESDTELEDED